nr:MAG TPA: hypothetical protein [Caudoviricetes sp.]
MIRFLKQEVNTSLKLPNLIISHAREETTTYYI